MQQHSYTEQLLKDQVFSFKYYSTRRWYKLSCNRESWAQISNIYLIKKAMVDSIYIANSCRACHFTSFQVPHLPDSLLPTGYDIIHSVIFGSAASSSRLTEMYPFANPGYRLAHEVTPSVILRKCISKSFFPLSWFPGSVSLSSLKYTEKEKA